MTTLGAGCSATSRKHSHFFTVLEKLFMLTKSQIRVVRDLVSPGPVQNLQAVYPRRCHQQDVRPVQGHQRLQVPPQVRRHSRPGQQGAGRIPCKPEIEALALGQRRARPVERRRRRGLPAAHGTVRRRSHSAQLDNTRWHALQRLARRQDQARADDAGGARDAVTDARMGG